MIVKIPLTYGGCVTCQITDIVAVDEPNSYPTFYIKSSPIKFTVYKWVYDTYISLITNPLKMIELEQSKVVIDLGNIRVY